MSLNSVPQICPSAHRSEWNSVLSTQGQSCPFLSKDLEASATTDGLHAQLVQMPRYYTESQMSMSVHLRPAPATSLSCTESVICLEMSALLYRVLLGKPRQRSKTNE